MNDTVDTVIEIEPIENLNVLNPTTEKKVGKETEEPEEPTEEDQCAICLDGISTEEKTRLACSHGYHKECIYRWLDQNSTCPICRYQVVVEPVIEFTNETNEDRPVPSEEAPMCSLRWWWDRCNPMSLIVLGINIFLIVSLIKTI